MGVRPNRLDLVFIVEDGHCMPVDEVTAREACRRMVAKGLTTEEMGRRVKRHPSTVQKWLREEGIEPAGRQVFGAARYETAGQREHRRERQRRANDRFKSRHSPPSVSGEG